MTRHECGKRSTPILLAEPYSWSATYGPSDTHPTNLVGPRWHVRRAPRDNRHVVGSGSELVAHSQAWLSLGYSTQLTGPLGTSVRAVGHVSHAIANPPM